ncbi:catechol o-methyltransferase [Phlyctema vagabunda]|uniref:catechol O-methyltransferase n=1 Tax=Phlyctema vagabunda TaxID=108571 RepID=A0ABR4PFH0_9HELO
MSPNGTSTFDNSKAYAEQEVVFFDDGREEELVEFVVNHPNKSSIKGSPEKVLRTIDEFGRTKKYLMNVGEDKGKIVTKLIQEVKPQTMVELGGYCGYSTILFASTVRDAGGKHYYSLERSPKFAKVIQTLVEFAGLEDTVEVIIGPSDEGIKKLYSRGVRNINMMFLDHYKPAYTTDLKLCEELGLIQKGTLLAADNVIKPGNPPYLAYVRSSVQEKRLKLTTEAKADTENFPGRAATQYNGSVEVLSTDVKGNPHLIYESKLVNSFEPTGEPDGVEVTRCLGEDKTQ